MIPPRRIVLSGGGIKVVSMVGALHALHAKGHLRKVKEICGVSAGAFLAFLLATGYPLDKLATLIRDLDFSVIRNLTPESFLGFPETFGLDDGLHLKKFLESIVRVVLKMDPEMTFKDLSAIGTMNFRCWATDMNTQKVREFSAAQTPDVRILDGLRASMCLPLYFIPVPDPITGHLLSDGGIQGNLPLHHLTEDECQESLSLGFSRKEVVKEEAPQDFMGFVNAIFGSLVHSRNEAILAKWAHMILRIPVDDYPSWNFEASREDRVMLFEKGRVAAEAWLASTHGHRRTIRRHSF
jgi:NTE family protein